MAPRTSLVPSLLERENQEDSKRSSLPASLSKRDEIPGAVTMKGVKVVPRSNAAGDNSREEI
jgi:hypothetical protein